MKVRVIDDFEEVLPLRAQWNDLADRSPSGTVFQTFEWFEAWWRVFGADRALRVVTVVDGDRLVAFAPLMTRGIRAYGRTLTCLTFTGGLQTDYADFLYEDESALGRLVQALRTDLAWDHLDLARIPAASATPRALAAAFPGWRGFTSISDICPAYVFDESHDGRDILEKKSVRRHVNGLRKAGAVEVHHLVDAPAVEAELDDFYQQHVERRALTDVPSNFVDPRARDFYTLLARGLAPRRRLLFTIVTLDGKPAAYHYGFVDRHRLVWYKPSFAPHLSRLSPGEVLLAELVTYCRAQGLSELDFTVGDEAFKTRFSNVKRQNLRFQAFRSRARQGLSWATRLAKERARRVNGLESLVRRLRSAI